MERGWGDRMGGMERGWVDHMGGMERGWGDHMGGMEKGWMTFYMYLGILKFACHQSLVRMSM